MKTEKTCKNLLVWLTPCLFSCDQAALWMVQSVRPSVRLSVTPFRLCSHHHIITKFSGVITIDKRSRSKVKVTGVIIQLSRFRIVNSNLSSPMATKWCTKLEVAKKRCPIVFQGHPSNFKVTWDKKSQILTRIECFQTVNFSLNSLMAMKTCIKLETI